ncbi:hypothetical protein SVAN01_01194 [Stagonosporopsis vannaccii]|nr:hypothetical protein SVAN01_01194 [Stagonosporopsis vannaccii]
MSSRLVSAALSRRTVTCSAALPVAQHSNSPRVEHINGNNTHYTLLKNSTPEISTQVLSLPTLALVKPLSQQATLIPALSSLRRPVDVLAKGFEENRDVDEWTRGFVFGKQHEKVACAWETVEKELWLERFGGPGRTIETASGIQKAVLRDAAPDGKGYLRVLI